MIGFIQKRTAAPLRWICIIALTALCGIGTKAQAQEATFDCANLMINEGLAEEPPQFAEASYFTLVAPPGFDVSGADPVNPIELLTWSNNPIYTISNVLRGQDPQFEMTCYLIIIKFELAADQVPLSIEDPNGNGRGQRLPVLVVLTEETYDELKSSIARWQASQFNISATFEGFQDLRRDVRPEDFGRLAAFNNPVWDVTSVRMIGIDNLPQDARDFLSRNAPDAEQIMVMCGFGPCHEASPLQVPRTIDPASPLADGTPADEVSQQNASDNEQTLSQTLPNLMDATVQQALTPKILQGGFTYIQRDGTETAAPFDNIDRLECILLALAPELFIAPIASCDSPAFKALRQTNALLQLGPENQIQVVAEARYPDVELVSATLPLGVDGLTCQLLLDFVGRDGQPISIHMEPVPGAEPAAFVAELAEPPLRDGTAVTMSILPLDPTACGVSDTYLQVSSEQSIDISLGKEISTTAILHLMLPRAAQMAEDLTLDEAGRMQFVQSLVNAVRGAHAQLSTRRSDNIWSLTQARLMSLTGTGDPNVIVALDSENLRNGGNNAFLRVGPNTIDDVADSSPQITAGTLSELLVTAGNQLSKNAGPDRLVVTLIAPISGRTALEIGDPCTDPLYQQLSDDLAAAEMIDTEVFVFPVVRMKEGDQIDITRLRPANPDALSPTLPSGLYQCVDSPSMVSILPYYFEPWRDPVEFAPRFATSLSGGLMMVLDDANTRGANE